MKISKLLKEPEGQTLSFSLDFPNRLELAKTISAFCNSNGGRIIIGAESGNEKLSHLNCEEIFNLQEKIKKLIIDLVEPTPICHLKVCKIDNHKILLLEILPGNFKPYFIKAKDKFNGTYIRVGARNQSADKLILDQLESNNLNITYDRFPVYEAQVEDLNTEKIEQYLEIREEKQSIPKVLVNYAFLDRSRLIVREAGRIYPTVAAILAFNDQPQNLIPNAKIECYMYDSEDKSRLLASKVYDGTLIEQYEKTISFFNIVDFPEEVLKELVLNAIIHRDYLIGETIKVVLYKDRFEILSPGFIPDGQTIPDMQNGYCVYKNHIIYKIFSDLGYTYTSGTGLQNVNKILKDSLFKEVEFSTVDNYLSVVVYNEPLEGFLSKEENKILNYFKENDFITNIQCQKLLKIKDKQAQYLLMKLVKKNKLRAIGDKKGRKYVLTDTE